MRTIHERAMDMADELRAFAEGIEGWPTTASLCRQAASSLIWQVRWEQKHPDQRHRQTAEATDGEA